MAYRLIDENFWRSPHLAGAGLETKAIYNYLITQGGKIGMIYRKKEEHLSLLEIQKNCWDRGIHTLIDRGRILVDEKHHLVLVKNHFRHQFRPETRISPQQDRGIKNECLGLPKTPLFTEFLNLYHSRLEANCPLTFEFLNNLNGLGELSITAKKENEKQETASPDAVKLTHTLIAGLQRFNPKSRLPAEDTPAFRSWTREMERFIRIEAEGDPREAEKVILFTVADSREPLYVQSPQALRKSWNRLTGKMRPDPEWKKPKETEDERISRAIQEGKERGLCK